MSLTINLIPNSIGWCQSQNLPLDHWAYSFLERLETRGLYISEDYDTRPYSREAIADIILQINENLQKDPALLSGVEQELFEQLKGEFHEELNQSGNNVDIIEEEKEPHIYSWRDEEIVVHFDGLLSHQSKLETKEDVDPTIPTSSSSWGLRFRTKLKNSLAIFAEARSFILSDADSLANTVFNPSLGLPVTRKALVDVTVSDNATGYAVFRLPWLDIEAGRDLVEWGPGLRGSLILSRNSNFYDLFKFTFRYKKFKFEHIHGFLNADSTKYVAGHRLEIRPFENFQFALNETVVYGNRSVEFLYVNPFVPIIISERHLGDQDNNMISFDASLFLYEFNAQIYAEILFDDFSFAKDIFSSFGNKWGVLFGGYWVNPFGLKDTEFRFELMRIQPFVYSHKRRINTYSNYNNAMGHWLGPDADDWYFEVARQFHKNIRIGVFWEQRRRGQNDITQGTRPEDGRIHFLDGPVERNRIFGFVARWQVHRDIFFNLTYNFIQTENLRREVGLDQNNHRVFLNVSVDY
ncbi:hypothetical protein GWN42_15610 [candidate division KSB1 bacterium]|nr:capsule assembly Wzi family protein [candidate division KSB1 bacterium]NIS27769.1 capsule assembly Wzi family protein [candidate division KSB1 bacterium]NIU28436.1 capsule assembly Wzi family protein [candidate division KSB1 bacterium]NIU91697.1 hypothetical protein [candidate division KSB1 bacterium]NIV94169.1 hypothetical protein [candidate division KSB1 bacterium]